MGTGSARIPPDSFPAADSRPAPDVRLTPDSRLPPDSRIPFPDSRIPLRGYLRWLVTVSVSSISQCTIQLRMRSSRSTSSQGSPVRERPWLERG